MLQDFFFHLLLSFWKICFSHSLRVDVPVENALPFLSFGISTPFPPEGQCQELQNVQCTRLTASTWNCCVGASGLHGFRRNALSFELFSPIGNMLLLSHCFQDIFFPLDFRSLVITCLGMNFSQFISLDLLSTSFFFPFIFISWRLITLQYRSGSCHTLTWISHGCSKLLDSIIWCLWSVWKLFAHLIFQPHFLLSFEGINMNVGSVFVILQVLEALFISF